MKLDLNKFVIDSSSIPKDSEWVKEIAKGQTEWNAQCEFKEPTAEEILILHWMFFEKDLQ